MFFIHLETESASEDQQVKYLTTLCAGARGLVSLSWKGLSIFYMQIEQHFLFIFCTPVFLFPLQGQVIPPPPGCHH
jgi:hypothetical protein